MWTKAAWIITCGFGGACRSEAAIKRITRIEADDAAALEEWRTTNKAKEQKQ